MYSRFNQRFSIRPADWPQDQFALRSVRMQVFVREQQVPEELEWDGQDATALHLIAESGDGEIIGTARLLPSGQIGRMAVLPRWRRRGVGTGLLLQLLRIAAEHSYPPPFLNAQTAVLPFYGGLGFAPEGDIFEEAGIPHQRMVLADPDLAASADIDRRRIGVTGGLIRIDQPQAQVRAVAAMAAQARHTLLVLTPDLEPQLYDQRPFLAAVRQLAVDRRGRLPVRILLIDAEPAVRRGHRLIELSRQLSSAVQIHAVPEQFAEQCDHFLVADDHGYCLRRFAAPTTVLADFADPAQARRLRRHFEQIWEQGATHPELRRLHL
jgi:predicted GNAT family N-acyltransferase